MGKKCFVLIILACCAVSSQAQALMGNVVDEQRQALIGASLHWLNTGSGTTTDANGFFRLERTPGVRNLVIRYTGYQADTVEISDTALLEVFVLREGIALTGVEVISERNSNAFSRLNPVNTESLLSKEFRKAACCSLSESFQTSNAVDVSYTNAATGSKEIQFLGLRGLYSELLIENKPAFAGILANAGYDLLSGTWLERVDIQKGASSVLNGANGMTGAINVQLKKPNEDHPVYANFFADGHGRLEGNLHLNQRWSEARSSGLYLNGTLQEQTRDHNGDLFQDEPRINRVNGLFRNTLLGHRFEGQVNAHALYEERTGGQLANEAAYRIRQKLEHFNLFGNLGYVGFGNPDQNSGSIYDLSYSSISGEYGDRHFQSEEKRAFLKLLYNHPFGDGRHQLMSGPHFAYSSAQENFSGTQLDYEEKVAGLFLEHTFRNKNVTGNSFTSTLGLHLEWQAGLPPIIMPRASMRYLVAQDWTLRASVGRGFRRPRILSENAHLFATSKQWVIEDKLERELSWNSGFNLVGKPGLFGNELEVNADFYLTWFEEQQVIDLDEDYSKVLLYALDGKSRAFQALLTLSYRFSPHVNAKLGGKYTDSRVQLRSGFRQLIMVPRYRAIASLDLETPNKKWLWNITANYVGKMRLPDKIGVPHEIIHEHDGQSKPYVLLQSQLSFLTGPWEFYTGGENLLDYSQHEAIIDASMPGGNYFNAAEVYAPVGGIKLYVGIKWRWGN
ncbi:MAG: TonB-dependent receptor [Saprospiraceae bacterium]|nr:TonB-dependent receptor [Saprospiraceae bacterium]